MMTQRGCGACARRGRSVFLLLNVLLFVISALYYDTTTSFFCFSEGWNSFTLRRRIPTARSNNSRAGAGRKESPTAGSKRVDPSSVLGAGSAVVAAAKNNRGGGTVTTKKKKKKDNITTRTRRTNLLLHSHRDQQQQQQSYDNDRSSSSSFWWRANNNQSDQVGMATGSATATKMPRRESVQQPPHQQRQNIIKGDDISISIREDDDGTTASVSSQPSWDDDEELEEGSTTIKPLNASDVEVDQKTRAPSMLSRLFSLPVETVVSATYFCHVIALTLPVLLLPLIAAEYASARVAMGDYTFNTAAFIASTASISTLGGAIGKLVNGFVCQILGGKNAASLYLLGSSCCSILLSVVNTHSNSNDGNGVGYILACMEFFGSILWTACSMTVSKKYSSEPTQFANAITTLSLSSTAGILLAKFGGTALLQLMMTMSSGGGSTATTESWRYVARLGALLGLTGSFIVKFLLADDYDDNNHSKRQQEQQRLRSTRMLLSPISSSMTTRLSTQPSNKRIRTQTTGSRISMLTTTVTSGLSSLYSILNSIFSSSLFWFAGFAHATAFLARTADRVLGAFFYDSTALPKQLCGGLTACVTIGFVHGIQTNGKTFQRIIEKVTATSYTSGFDDDGDQTFQKAKHFLLSVYGRAVLASFGLAMCANTSLMNMLVQNRTVLAIIIAILAGCMASSLSFQFFQFPPLVAKRFHNSGGEAVCLSYIDGMGFLLSASFWAFTSNVVHSMNKYGWTIAFIMLGLLYGIGGIIMSNNLHNIIDVRSNGDDDNKNKQIPKQQ